MPITEKIQEWARQAAMHSICKYGIESAKSQRRLLLWPYKLATKMSLLLGKDIW